MIGNESRILELEDELHSMRSEQQALLSLDAVRWRQMETLRAALQQVRTLIEGIETDWMLRDPAEIIVRTKREMHSVAASVRAALIIENRPIRQPS